MLPKEDGNIALEKKSFFSNRCQIKLFFFFSFLKHKTTRKLYNLQLSKKYIVKIVKHHSITVWEAIPDGKIVIPLHDRNVYSMKAMPNTEINAIFP